MSILDEYQQMEEKQLILQSRKRLTDLVKKIMVLRDSYAVLLPGKSHGWRSLVGCSPWGR